VLTVLSVAYPLAAVREDTAGGAEQVLAMLDAALVREGHRSVVVACEGSEVAGTLVATPRVRGVLDERAKWIAQARHRTAIRLALDRWPVDLVHFHGQDFHAYLPEANLPKVVTLHVPREWYAVQEPLPGVRYVCVSQTQQRTWPFPAEVIENGVEPYTARIRKRGFALSLGRVSPEKGTALAIEAARIAGVPILVAGEVYGYEEHERYFHSEVLPKLNGTTRRFIGAVGLARKRRLLAAARCLVVASQVRETSSLVAMEALGCGTPVVAFPAGALAEIVEHGRTGFLVRDVREMADAIAAAPSLNLEPARNRFPARRTVERYLALYRSVAETGVATWTSRP
jgi:glycosyltransferase involved in cell wall biosynthesis